MLKNDQVLALIEQFNRDLSAIELASNSAGGIFDALQSAREHLEESKKVMFAAGSDESRPSSPVNLEGSDNNDKAPDTPLTDDNNQEDLVASAKEGESELSPVDNADDLKSQNEETLMNDSEQLTEADELQEVIDKEKGKGDSDPKIILNNNQPVQTEEVENSESSVGENASAEANKEMESKSAIEQSTNDDTLAKTEDQNLEAIENQPQENATDSTGKTEPEQQKTVSTESKTDLAPDSAQASLVVPQTEALGNDAVVPDHA